jgi:hypothetical protein
MFYYYNSSSILNLLVKSIYISYNLIKYGFLFTNLLIFEPLQLI